MQLQLLNWYDKNRRRMPWRLKKPNPYKTWVSEIMLQQTQVETVTPYFKRFLATFPDVQSLSAAPIETVLAHWSGLGYYLRARNLHKAAQKIVQQFGGQLPSTVEELLTLPGVGRYTAGAIASIAFEKRAPILDGNVIRVLTRLRAWKGNPKSKELNKKLWNEAERILPQQRMGDFNQALMELGATLCKMDQPKCDICPLRSDCKAFSLKKVHDFPTPQKKEKTISVVIEAALIERNGKYLIVKRNGARHLKSMWEFPQKTDLGLILEKVGTLSVKRHSIMNRRIQLRPVCYQYRKGKPARDQTYTDFAWIRPEELSQYPTSSLNKKAIQDILSGTVKKHPPSGQKNKSVA